ncbi:MFS-type transporter SLC18B1 isoform X1 [Parasteatoda tepidariorum]|uniref:MFS-type transporter SLC18B1 isoform X1 n=1 Tax=Parasteatoda tepidariorum TaxID=114398 RepID=UPI001C717F79|nr:MFS-type transporter SLC18B1 isoform X2 [Parasteatoda tepidariorum]
MEAASALNSVEEAVRRFSLTTKTSVKGAGQKTPLIFKSSDSIVEQTQLSVLSNEVTANGNNISPHEKQNKSGMTLKKFKILAAIFYGNLFLGSCYSLMAPIYPAEAERKHCTASAYGLVFGVYQLMMSISAPIYGKIIVVLKPGFMMKVGMFVSGVCVILFSFMHYAPSGNSFIALSMLVRAVDALGASAFLTASYTTLGCELPDIIGRAMAIIETAFSFGLAIGPVIGGMLFQVGGFSLPFLVVGGLLLTGTVVNIFLFKDVDDVPPQSIRARDLIKDIDFQIDILVIMLCFAMLGFNEATLEPHIRQFNFSPTIVGCIFLIEGVVDAVIAPIWGLFAERVPNAQCLTIFGALAFIVAFIIIGPLPFFNIHTQLSLVIVSQVLIGIGMAGEIVCSFTHGMKHTVERGFPDNVGTYGLVSGILFSVSCFGAFFGPSIGGFLIDSVGYEYATFVVVIGQSAVTVILVSRLLYKRKTRNKKPEGEKVGL